MQTEDSTDREAQARSRAKSLIDLAWHTGTFVIINAALWLLDAVTDGRITWAYWVTLFWGIGLAFHVLAWMVEGARLEDRLTQRYLRKQDRSAPES